MKSVIFIMGPGHCGSTLLDLILGSHSAGFSLAEFRVITRLLNASSRLPDDTCVICDGTCSFWNQRVSQRDLRLFYSKKNILDKVIGRIVRRFRNPYDFLFAASGNSMLVDSSKTPAWIKRQLDSPWKDIVPQLIYMKRDGRAVVNSYLRKYPERGFDAFVHKWIRNVTECNECFDSFPGSKTVVHYEDLAKNAEPCVMRLCDAIGIEFEKDMLRYWTHDHHPIAGNGGTQSLILKFREQLHETTSEYRTAMNADDRYYDSQYYEDIGLAIRFDERWKRELNSDQIRRFDELTGNLNADRAH